LRNSRACSRRSRPRLHDPVTLELEQLSQNIIALARSGSRESAVEAHSLCSKLPALGTDSGILGSALIETAVSLENHGELHRAVELYTRLTEDAGTAPDVRANAAFRLGAALGLQGMTDASRRALLAATDYGRDGSIRRMALFQLAHSYACERQYDDACQQLEQLLLTPGDDPSPLAAQLKLIHCRARAGSAEVPEVPFGAVPLTAIEAAAWMEAALSLEQSGRDDLSTQMFERLGNAGPVPDAIRGHALWNVVVAVLASDPANAPALVPRLLEYEGDDPPAAMLWGKAIECVARRRNAETADVESIWSRMPGQITDQIASGMMQAAFALEQCGHVEPARWAYEKLLSYEGVPPAVQANAHLRLGIVLDALGFWDTAVREFEAASGVAEGVGPVQSEAAYRVAQARQMTEQYASAAELYGRLRGDAMLPAVKRAQAQLQYGNCLLRSGDRQRAMAEFEEARKSANGETSLKAEITLAEIYEATRDIARARECYERVLSHPNAEPVTRAAALNRLQKLKG
jgi:tetratricopeptide (TPR) repeat protein